MDVSPKLKSLIMELPQVVQDEKQFEVIEDSVEYSTEGYEEDVSTYASEEIPEHDSRKVPKLTGNQPKLLFFDCRKKNNV